MASCDKLPACLKEIPGLDLILNQRQDTQRELLDYFEFFSQYENVQEIVYDCVK